MRRGKLIHNRRKERRKTPLYPHPCTLSPSRNGTPELKCSEITYNSPTPLYTRISWDTQGLQSSILSWPGQRN